MSARACYRGPDGKRYSQTFGDKLSAQMWLVEERKLIDRGVWRTPDHWEAVRRITVSQWAAEYVESRTLAPGTYCNHTRMVARCVDPTIGRKYLDDVTVTDVSTWHAQLKADLRRRARQAFLASFDTCRANNGGTEAINGLIEPHCRIARGLRNREQHRPRILLIGGGLAHTHLR